MFTPQRIEYQDPQTREMVIGFAAVDTNRQVKIVLFAGDPGFGRCLYISPTQTLVLTFDKQSRPESGYCEIYPSWRDDLRIAAEKNPVDDAERRQIDNDMSEAIRTCPSPFGLIYSDIRIKS